MVTILVGNANPDIFWDKDEKVFYGSEIDLKFASDYLVKNEKTKVEKKFEFSHSTGPEFAPTTMWIYKTKEENPLELRVCNDPKVTAERAKLYLKAKTR